MGSRFLRLSHILFQHIRQSLGMLLNAGAADGISGNGDEAVRVSGYIDFKADGTVIDVIAVLVIGRERCFEKDADAGPGRAVFGVGVHPGDDVLRYIRQHTVFDAMVDVDGADIVKHADADPVISSSVAESCVKISEGGLIRGIGLESIHLIRHFCPVTVSFFIFPEAERASCFQFLRQLFVRICNQPFRRASSRPQYPLEGFPSFERKILKFSFTLPTGDENPVLTK